MGSKAEDDMSEYIRIKSRYKDSDYPGEDVSVGKIAAGNYPWESYYNLELSDITVKS